MRLITLMPKAAMGSTSSALIRWAMAMGMPVTIAVADAAAAQNFVGELCRLAICYVNGMGVARGTTRAASLCKRALAHPGCPPLVAGEVACILGSVYWDGDGVPRDRELGARYWRQAAALGSMPAARELREQGLAQGLKYRRRGSRPAWVRWNYVGFPRLG